MAEKQLYLTPRAEAMYPFLTKPSTQFDKEGTYKVSLLLDPGNQEHKDFLVRLKGHLEEGQKTLKDKKANNKPWKKNKRVEDGSETGLFEVQFKSQYPPRLFDAVGNKVTGDLNVGNGSIIRVAYKFAPYEGFGGGIAMYLQAVQILELVEWSGGAASDYGFTSETGAFNVEDRFAGAMAEEGQSPQNQDSHQPTADDDIPF